MRKIDDGAALLAGQGHAAQASYRTAGPKTSTDQNPNSARRQGSAFGEVAFERFCAEHRRFMCDYVARRLRGSGLDPDDIVQEALVAVWRQWERWPADPARSSQFLRRALKLAALSALRARDRRMHDAAGNSIAVREQPVDMAADLCASDPDGPAGRLASEVGEAIARDSAGRDGADDAQFTSVVISTLAVLSDAEREVFLSVWAGYDCIEVAQRMGLTHQRIRTHLMAARRILFALLDHGDSEEIPEPDRRELLLYLNGNLKGERRKHMIRHVSHCPKCRRLADRHHGNDPWLAAGH